MSLDDIKIVCIKEPGTDVWCAYIKGLPAICAQVSSPDEAPERLGEIFKALLRFSYRDGNIKINI